jgi:hypothetical protein
MFRLTSAETEALNRPQIVTGSQKHRDPPFPPYVFIEHGAIMAATTLNSTRAVKMSVYVVRAFVQLRGLLVSNHQGESGKLGIEERAMAAQDEGGAGDVLGRDQRLSTCRRGVSGLLAVIRYRASHDEALETR